MCRETGDSDSDAYDAGSAAGAPPLPAARPAPPPPARPSAMALVAPRGPARTLWCEVPEVVESAVLSEYLPTAFNEYHVVESTAITIYSPNVGVYIP